jgi:hypothetical protein
MGNGTTMSPGFRERQVPRKTTSTPSLSVQASIGTNSREAIDYEMHEVDDSNDTEDMLEENSANKKH